MQAKKNMVSGKVFEAHEEVIRQQRSMESKEQQIQQLQSALEHERHLRQEQLQELEQLRQQLHDRTEGVNSAAKQRSLMPQLPIQQMLAAQAAEAEASPAHSSRSRSRAVTTGGVDESGYTGSPASISRIPARTRVDMTPARDQDGGLVSLCSRGICGHLDPVWCHV